MNKCTCGLSTEVACWLHKDDCPFYCPPDEPAKELERCRQDPVYFFSRYSYLPAETKADQIERLKKLIELGQDGSYEIASTHSETVALAIWFRAMVRFAEKAVLDSSPQPSTR